MWLAGRRVTVKVPCTLRFGFPKTEGERKEGGGGQLNRAGRYPCLTGRGQAYWNLIPDSLDQVESQMDSNAIYYFEFQTWNLALQPT